MTRNRSWLALAALLAAIAGGALWAAEQEKKSPKSQAPDCCSYEKGCCAEKCSTKEKMCCAAEKAKSSCGCCEKAPQTATLPVPPGSAIQVMIAPPGAFEGGGPMDWACPTPSMTPPPPAPVCQAACPVPFAYTTQVTPAPCIAPPPPPAPTPWNSRPTPWRVCVVVEGGKSRLGMHGVNKDASATCENLTLKVGGELKLSVAGKQVQVSGKCVQATADSVSWSADNGEIVLDGTVKLKYEGDAHKAEITAQQVIVNVPDGRIEVRGAGSIAPQTLPVRPGSPSLSDDPVRCPACPRSTEAQQLFNFWTGFFH